MHYKNTFKGKIFQKIKYIKIILIAQSTFAITFMDLHLKIPKKKKMSQHHRPEFNYSNITIG